jgi:hypothetical protein
METFEIELKNEKSGTYTIISWLITCMNLIGFIFYGITSSGSLRIYAFGAAVLLLFTLFMLWSARKKAYKFDYFSVAFTIIITGWIILSSYLSAAINFVLYIFQDITRRKLIVLVFPDRIVYPSFPKKTLQWNDLNNVILRDGILTIDQKDNRVFQNEIISEINELEFNEFCRRHLEALPK